jgi:hypothetical protein
MFLLLRYMALQVGGLRVPPFIPLAPTALASTVDAAVPPHLPLMTTKLLYQVLTGLFIAPDQEHPVLIGHNAFP